METSVTHSTKNPEEFYFPLILPCFLKHTPEKKKNKKKKVLSNDSTIPYTKQVNKHAEASLQEMEQ